MLDEEKKAQEIQKQTEGQTEKKATTSIIEEANRAAERLEAANKEKERLLQKEEELLAEKRLGGQTEAGVYPQKREESPSEYRKRIETELRQGKY